MKGATSRDWLRAALARTLEQEPQCEGPSLDTGPLELAPFQYRAARRLVAAIDRFGGALHADAVGLGKTRVGLAVARTMRRAMRAVGDRGPVWFCVPARLREPWREAAVAGGLAEGSFDIVTHTALSRGYAPTAAQHAPSFLVVDEAHRFRNPASRRHRRLAQLTADTPVLLLTATPVANSVWDLFHLLDLFVADHDLRRLVGCDLREAFARAERGEGDLVEVVQRLVVRRDRPPEEAGFGRRPTARLEVLHYDPEPDEAWLWQHLEAELAGLTLVLLDDDWPRGLLVEHILRRWESGPEALLETLTLLEAYHERWLEAQASGGRLSRVDFRRLFEPSAFRQGVFGFVFRAGTEADEAREQPIDAEQVRADRERLLDLVLRARRAACATNARHRAIADLAADGEKLLVFTSFQAAAEGLYEALRRSLGPKARIGLLTGSRAEATGLGRTRPQEVLRRFAPAARGVEMATHHSLQILVCTDCVAEGIDLQDCGRLVLADLPYSPLAVEQRIGRLLRPGGPHREVLVYLPRPRQWSDSLGLRRRLRAKLEQARQAGTGFEAMEDGLGRGGAPGALGADATRSPLAALTAADGLLAQLGRESTGEGSDDGRLQLGGEWVCRDRRLRPGLWAVIAIDDVDWARAAIIRADDEGVEARLHRLLPELIALADASSPLEAGAVSVSLYAMARDHARARRDLLNAARAAPVALELDGPQLRLWRRLQGAMEAGRLPIDRSAWEALRARLLQPMPRGWRERLERLAISDVPPARTLRALDFLPQPPAARPIGVRILSVLEVRAP